MLNRKRRIPFAFALLATLASAYGCGDGAITNPDRVAVDDVTAGPADPGITVPPVEITAPTPIIRNPVPPVQVPVPVPGPISVPVPSR